MRSGQYAAVNTVLIKKILFFLPSIPYHRIIINSTVCIPFKRRFLCRSHTFVFGSMRKGLVTSTAKQNKEQELTQTLPKTKKHARKFGDKERFAL